MASMDDWDSIESTQKRNTYSPKNTNRSQPSINRIDENFELLLNQVIKNEQFGINMLPIELLDASSSCGRDRGDKFKISIPYANQHLQWSIMFNSGAPHMGPDLEFFDKWFLPDPTLDYLEKFVPNLVNWDHTDSNCLMKVISEFRICYRQHQIDKMLDLKKMFQEEYFELFDTTGIDQEDVEVVLLPNVHEPTEVLILIKIAFDFPKLPGRDSDLELNTATLSVVFHGPSYDRVTSQLVLSSSLDKALGGSNSLHIPPYSQSKHVIYYVEEIKKLIGEKINLIISNHLKRSDFISSLLVMHGEKIFEYDALNFTFAVLMLENQDFHFLVRFTLTENFPADKPKILLISIYHMRSKDELFEQSIDTYPYHPQWDPPKMIYELIKEIVGKRINGFKNSSTRYRR